MFAYGTAGQIRWKENISHWIEVEFVASRRGLFQFYVSASSKIVQQEFSHDPANAPLRDQRDEPVYCGVIEIKELRLSSDRRHSDSIEVQEQV